MPWRTNIGAPFHMPALSANQEFDTIADNEPVQGFVSRDGERDCMSVHSSDMSWIDLGVKTEGETAATPADLEASEFKAAPPVVKKPKLVQNKNFAGPSEALLMQSWNLSRKTSLCQPWESGTMGMIFGHKPEPLPPWMQLPSVGKFESLAGLVPVSEPAVNIATRTPFYRGRLLAIRMARTDDQLRAKAIRKLRDLILVQPADSKLGRQLLDACGQLVGEDVIADNFNDAFRSRATATLVKRASDYHRMAVWLRDVCNLAPLQVTEDLVYRYLCHLRSTGAAPTLADTTVKAIWFMHSTVGFTNFDPRCVTSRVIGVCREMFLRKRVLKQAVPFTVTDVLALEDFALDRKQSFQDTYFANFILFCIYSGSRIGDATKMTNVRFSRQGDVHLVEAATAEAKNSTTKERRTRLMPFAALGWGLSLNPWCIKWEMQINELGSQWLMPAFSEMTGCFLERRLTTSEANHWLRDILFKAGLTEDAAMEYSTHSCKATLATWAGKFSGFSIDEKRMLTHHLQPDAMMPLLYSRDNVTALQIKIFRMLHLMRTGAFQPDLSAVARIEMAVADIDWAPPQDAEWDQSDSDVSDDEVMREDRALVQDSDMAHRQDPGAIRKLRIHVVSSVVHQLRDDSSFRCGRDASHRYRELLESDQLGQLLMCQQCSREPMHEPEEESPESDF